MDVDWVALTVSTKAEPKAVPWAVSMVVLKAEMSVVLWAAEKADEKAW